MNTRIQKWGNSNAVRLPKAILDVLNWRENDRVEIVSDNNQIIIRAKKRKYTSLDEVFEGYSEKYLCEEAYTGIIGQEVM